VLGTGGGWDQVLGEINPLVEWRRKMGWTVDVLRLDNTQDANTVRQALQTYYRDAEVKPEAIAICGDTDGQFPFGYFDKRAGAAYPYESDFDFGALEGDDMLPEASVGRLVFEAATGDKSLRNIVAKTIHYEADPFLGEGNDAGWQKHGAVEATSPTAVSTIDICRWSKK